MSVTVNHHIRSVPLGELRRIWAAELVTVANVDGDPADRDENLLRQARRIGRISISEDRTDGRYERELIEYVLSANVSSVEYQLDTGQSFVHSGSDQPMGVGDQTYGMSVSGHQSFYIGIMAWIRLVTRLALRTIRRPRLGIDLLKIAWRFRSREWYKRFPFIPFPDPTYLRWRMYTAYGDYNAIPSARDVERYARWAGEGE